MAAEVIDIVEAFKDAKRRNPPRDIPKPYDRFEALLDAMPDYDEAVLELCRDVIFPRLKTIFAERGEKLVIRRVPA
jgi:hypothetical protein